MPRPCFSFRLWSGVLGVLFLTAARVPADEVSELKEQLRQLLLQNQQFQEQASKQQQLIETLGRRVSELEAENAKRASEYRSLSAEVSKPAAEPAKSPAFGKVIVSGEGGLAFFHSDSAGKFPNSEFRVDEAKLFLEASVWKDVYIFTELDITTREQSNEDLRVSELYLDFENISRLWDQDRWLNLRVGRFDIPFGEEYLVRDAIDNPLISHSLTDFWGVDEGLELYGSIGKWQYAFAVQNGGHPGLRDYDDDKAVVGRVGIDPTKWLHLSVSAMRTGDLDTKNDKLSELWIGNGFVRPVGSTNTTGTFHAELVEGDVQLLWSRGHLKAAGGVLWYDDNDSAANNERGLYYYYVEGLYNLTSKFYGAARFSQIICDEGFPIVGHSSARVVTSDVWRLSLGLGYRFSRDLLLKGEYSLEQGEEPDGDQRAHEHSFGAELAFRF